MISISRCILSATIAAQLAGCGGSQPPIGTSAQSSAGALVYQYPATRSGQSLMYLAGTRGTYDFRVEVRSYPSAKLITTFDMPNDYNVGGMCSDAKGDVFITADVVGLDDSGGYIYEYAPGGTSPIATFNDNAGPYHPVGCAVDPTTGNLAVGNVPTSAYSGGNLAVYKGTYGTPTFYSDSAFVTYNSPTYDNNGNLFILGQNGKRSQYEFAELPNGGASLENVNVEGKVERPTWIQWDGADVAFLGGPAGRRQGRPVIFRVNISGLNGTVVSKTSLRGYTNHFGEGFCIVGNTVVMTAGVAKKGWQLGLWNYPGGGAPKAIVPTGMDESNLSAVTLNASL